LETYQGNRGRTEKKGWVLRQERADNGGQYLGEIKKPYSTGRKRIREGKKGGFGWGVLVRQKERDLNGGKEKMLQSVK